MTKQLTDRQLEIVALIACGMRSHEIARTLGMSDLSVRRQIEKARRKLLAPVARGLPLAAKRAGYVLPSCETIVSRTVADDDEDD